jgi:hypothetical protein
MCAININKKCVRLKYYPVPILIYGSGKKEEGAARAYWGRYEKIILLLSGL